MLLGVYYTPGTPPTIESIRVLDAEYKHVGPDLTELLLELCFLTLNQDEKTGTATPCLAILVEEIPDV